MRKRVLAHAVNLIISACSIRNLIFSVSEIGHMSINVCAFDLKNHIKSFMIITFWLVLQDQSYSSWFTYLVIDHVWALSMTH